ncbi:DNA recombination protein RmuC [Patescibacteria group bacterium]|nr:DNA recombination protein RmuC [Patescibacteria group bacterium]
MSLSTILIASLIIVGFASFYYLLGLRLKQFEDKQSQDQSTKLLQEWMKQTAEQTDRARKEMQDRLDKTGNNINERLDNAAKVIRLVSKELGEMSEIGRQMKSLQDFLKSPKLRGNIGEQVLQDLLKQNLSHQQFTMQYSFRNGTVVDAAIITDQGIIPVDAKFPMENFTKMAAAENEADEQRARRDFVNDVRKHIRDISKKYILPAEKTVNYALMYIPSEAIAYEITVNIAELVEYAREQRVYPASPNQFNSFLQMILLGMEGKKIEEKARFILNSIQAIQKDTQEFGENFRVMLKHLTNAKSKADEVTTDFDRLANKISSVQQVSGKTSESLLENEQLDLG